MHERSRPMAATLSTVLTVAAGFALMPASGLGESIDPPAPPGATAPALAEEGATSVTKEHEILLTWLEPWNGGQRLRFARRSEDGWSQPITVAEPVRASAGFPSFADRPSLTVLDTQAVRRTLIARSGGVIARSGDAGRTWTRLPSPPLPFASFAGGEEGGYAFWLEPEGGVARLFGSRILAGESLLDTRVATTATAAAMTWDGPVVAFRDQSAHGAQDIAIVRREDARWTSPRVVRVEGRRPAEPLPHGPEIAALERRVAIVWLSPAENGGHLVAAFSDDAGRSFGTSRAVTAPGDAWTPTGSVDVALDDDGQALVLWPARGASDRTSLRLTRVHPDGRRGRTLELATDIDDGLDALPQIVRARERVALAWVDRASARLRTVSLPLTAIPAPERDHRSTRGEATAVADDAASRPGRGRVGDRVPELALTTMSGDAVSLPSLEGQAVLINLWATWCIPCVAEMPELAAIRERHADQGLAVVGVTVDSSADRAKVESFVEARGIDWDVWLDPEMELYAALRVRTLPVTLVIDRRGQIIWRRDRAIAADDPTLEKALARALRE